MKFKKYLRMPNKETKERVLGIDPGYERIGVAVVEKKPKGKDELVYSTCIITSNKLPHSERLRIIGDEIKNIIHEYEPTHLAIEKLFFNENQKTALLVSEARGVILYVSCAFGLIVREFTPLEIKIAITGYGRADKKQMINMVPRLIALKKEILLDDEFDAIAAALTYMATRNSIR